MELASSMRRVEARCQEAEKGGAQEREGREEAEHQLTAAQRKVRQLFKSFAQFSSQICTDCWTGQRGPAGAAPAGGLGAAAEVRGGRAG